MMSVSAASVYMSVSAFSVYLTTAKRQTMMWYGHVMRQQELTKQLRKQQCKQVGREEDRKDMGGEDLTEWTGKTWEDRTTSGIGQERYGRGGHQGVDRKDWEDRTTSGSGQERHGRTGHQGEDRKDMGGQQQGEDRKDMGGQNNIREWTGKTWEGRTTSERGQERQDRITLGSGQASHSASA